MLAAVFILPKLALSLARLLWASQFSLSLSILVCKVEIRRPM